LIDRIRHDIQELLDQLLSEADKLRQALAALDPRERRTKQTKSAKPQAAAKQPSAKASSPRQPRARTRRGATASITATPARTAPGETKAKVLAALSHDGALTASDVAKATGLGRATVSTTLSKLAKAGEVAKAERGYRLRNGGGSESESSTEPSGG